MNVETELLLPVRLVCLIYYLCAVGTEKCVIVSQPV